VLAVIVVFYRRYVAWGQVGELCLLEIRSAATGTIVGALTEAGVSEEEAPLRRRCSPRRDAGLGTRTRRRAGAVRIDLGPIGGQYRERSAAWQRSGWKTFDASAQPYTADDVRKERQLL